MFKSCLKTLGIAAVLSLSFGSAQAITLDAGEMICEGPGAFLPDICADMGLPTFGDGDQTPPGETVEILFTATDDSGMIFGGIRGAETVFTDNFTLDGTGLYRLTLELIGAFGPSAPEFDAVWTQAGSEVGILGTGGSATLIRDVSIDGGSLFSLNAAGGAIFDGTVGQYKLTVTSVPLPAGAVLLLSGLGGLAIARRRKKA
ncbi:MAG: VPLPA-CTERM sorting domain-containing protein [Pseudomonadota bacterium]